MTKKTNMISYILKRLLVLVPMLIIVTMLTWIGAQFLPGDPSSHIPYGTDPRYIEAYREKWGFNDPWYVQFWRYIIGLFRGDLGVSVTVSPNENVVDLMKEVVPRTIELAIIPMILIPIIGIRLGVLSAQKRNKPFDIIIRGIAVIGVAFPSFWIAMLFQFGFGYKIPKMTGGLFKLPTFGYKSPGFPDPPALTGFRIIDSIIAGNGDLLMDTLIHLILPVLTLTFLSFATITRQTRSGMLEILQQDYIRTARAKGCNDNLVYNKHALRNALIPTTTLIVNNAIYLLGGAVIIEMVFEYKGLGWATIKAIQNYDYWVICATVIVYGILVIIGNLIEDILYVILDPRITY